MVLSIASPLFAMCVVDPLRFAIVDSPARMLWLDAWSAGTFLFVAVVVALDGGIRSPLVLLFFLALQFVAMGYPPHVVRAFSVLATLEVLAIGIAVNRESGASVFVTTTMILMTGVLGVGASTNRARQREAQERLAARLSFLARHDPLTGCLNRRSFDEALQGQYARASRTGSTVGLLLVDVDDFKSINDTFGHQVGDRTLTAVADALTASVREGDAVARVGGDEFAVVLADPDVPDLVAIRARIRDRLATAELPHPVEVSIGGSLLWARESDAVDLIRLADAELYADKQARRDRRIAQRSAKTWIDPE